MSDPLPCPFCGEEPKARPTRQGDYLIECEHEACWARAYVGAINRVEAVRLWNTRYYWPVKEIQ